MRERNLVIQEILERMLWFHGMEPDTTSLAKAVEQVMNPEEGEPPQSWFEVLHLAGEDVKLQFHPVTMPLEQLSASPEVLPVVAYRAQAEPEQQWVGILEQRRNRFLVTFFQPGDVPVWMTSSELAEVISDYDETLPICWMTASLAAPLEAWKDEEITPSDASLHHSVWPRLFGLLQAEKKELWVIVVYAVVVGIFSLATPVAVQALVNSVAFGTLLQPLVVLSLMLMAGLGFVATMQGIQIYLSEMISRRVFVRVASDFSYRLPRVSTEALIKKDKTELSNYFFDVLTVQKTLSVLLFDGLTSTLSILSGLLLLAIYHPILLAFDVILIATILVVIYVLGRGAIATSIKESKSKHKAAAWLDRMLQHPVLFKSHGGQQIAQERGEWLTRDYLKAREKHFRILMRQIVAGLLIQVFANSLLLLVGGWLVISQQLTLGQLVAAELVVSLVVASLFKVVKQFEKFYDLLASLDKLGKIVDLPTDRTDGTYLPPQSQALGLSLLDINYVTTTGRNIFAGLNLEVEPGTKLGITGPVGAGKSLLADMIFGLATPKKGQILLGEHALSDINLTDVRRTVSLVRDVELIEGSVWDNISLYRSDVTRTSARRALKEVGLLADVLALPEGLNTKLGPQGAPLSQQQLLLLMLARSLAFNPNILVIDGILDRLDEEHIEVAKQALFGADCRPFTLVVMTHHPEVMASCDVTYALSPQGFYLPNSAPSSFRITG
ncbi:MAG: ATP-binding cassette domain-containing protein [Deltaproteobacteria bacterium]|nr:MAG: ATP-binding cassette domain-containing protein [Deltaproteobacteria bacterium]